MKNAYHILSDLHFAWTINARKNYTLEIMSVVESLIKQLDAYEKRGYKNHLLLLGDFFHRGFSDPSEAMSALEFTRMLFSNFASVYAVIGNHELSFYKNNPFWYLVSEIKDEDVLKLHKKLKQPKGFQSDVKIVDFLRDGEVVFSFNHYDTNVKIPDPTANVNIGLFHQNIASKNLPIVWETYKDIDDAEEFIGYNYLFIGHNHSNAYYGKYELDSGAIAYFLASLGRPNHLEVDNKFLERNIPVVLVTDGVFEDVEDNFFNLMTREDCVVEEMISANLKAREALKQRKEIYSSSVSGTNLLEITKQNTKIAGVDSLFSLLTEPIDTVKEEYRQLLEELKKGENNE